jgi:hypothetical protein
MSTISAGNTTTTAFKVTADTTGNLVFATGGANTTALTLSNTQAATFTGAVTANSIVSTGTINALNTFGFENRLINGAMQIAQRGTSTTVTAGTGVPTASTGYPCVDRWFVYSTGANITAAQVAGSGNNRNNLQITGAASVTAVGVGQRIEQLNSYDLAGRACNLSVNMSNSLLTTVTWTASYATTADTFGTIGTPTKTQISTGTFTVTSTLTQYTVNISVPAAATTGIEILFTVGAQTSGTWVIGNVQFELGSQATNFDFRSYGTELALCQRYYCKSNRIQFFNPTPGSSQTYMWCNYPFPVNMRTSPTITFELPNASTQGQLEIWGGTPLSTSSADADTKGLNFAILASGSSTSYLVFGKFYASAEL